MEQAYKHPNKTKQKQTKPEEGGSNFKKQKLHKLNSLIPSNTTAAEVNVKMKYEKGFKHESVRIQQLEGDFRRPATSASYRLADLY